MSALHRDGAGTRERANLHPCRCERERRYCAAQEVEDGTTPVFVPAGAWVSATGVTGARGFGEMRNRNGNVVATPAVQFANDTHDPGTSSTAVGATMAADGVSDPSGVTVVSTGAFRFARPGWNVNLSPAGVLATASVSGVIELIRS